jgi:hypothetical protein
LLEAEQILGDEVEHRTEGDRQRYGDADAQPDLPEQAAPVRPDEESDEDADHERGLQPFAEPDQVVAHERVAHRDSVRTN